MQFDDTPIELLQFVNRLRDARHCRQTQNRRHEQTAEYKPRHAHRRFPPASPIFDLATQPPAERRCTMARRRQIVSVADHR